MQVIAFIFGIFGLMAYLEVSSLKGRISDLEEALANLKGSSFHEDRSALFRIISDHIGKKVMIDLKEDQEDVDVIMYGNTKYGSNTIVDADRDWLLVHIETPKGNKDKLIRMQSIERISLLENKDR
ncbi:MAG: hypothetical protein IKF68_06195 [Erysipelotrichaceae bacterium]|nr:hypothetical protein [Erysipelotrichaceae bacterium]